ncbi:MAG: hypothetical protein KDC53_10490 [Saprospiraceae bacterium]|nr:hypothetical protein [Saprospiraceae bacterium]
MTKGFCLQDALKVLFLTFSVLCGAFSISGQAQISNNALTDSDIQEIYKELIAFIGYEDRIWPKLKVLGVRNRVASYSPLENTIWIDRQALAICGSLGAQSRSATSFLIAHELAHFYRKHSEGTRGFAEGFLNSQIVYTAQQKDEVEADVFGAFIAEQAGYKVVSVVDTLLDLIYQDYLLKPEASHSYPDLEERKKIAHESCNLAQDLVDIYQTANYALALGLYSEAIGLYRWIKSSLTFEALSINLAMAYLGNYFVLSDTDLKYPLLIKPEIPIIRDMMDFSPEELLIEANKEFGRIAPSSYSQNAAIRMYNTFVQYKIKGLSNSIEMLEENGNKKNVEEKIILANLLATEGFISESKKLYQTLIEKEVSPGEKALIDYNLNIISQDVNKKQLDQVESHQGSIEKNIDGIPSINRVTVYDQELQLNENQLIRKKHQFGSVFVNLVARNYSIFKLQRIFDSSVKSSNGLFIGQPFNAWTEIYPHYQILSSKHSRGSYAIITEVNIICKLDQAKSILEWCIYSY